MEINKQLFEDVLSGKLKGTFVLRNGSRCSDKQLYRNHNWHAESCPYRIRCRVYRSDGVFGLFTVGDSWDIIDFIPDTNMKENELTIEIPDDKIVDWDESKKQNKIVLKDKQSTYEDICKKIFPANSFYYINENGRIVKSGMDTFPFLSDANNATTKHQLECILAKNKLANVAKYLNDGWKPSFGDIYVLTQTPVGISAFRVAKGSCASDCGSIWFKSLELAQQAIEILGEETVKLALEPLGI